MLGGPERLEVVVGPEGPAGDFELPSGYDGTWEVTTVGGRPWLRPTESAYYLYAVLPEGFKRRAGGGVHVEVEYWGAQYGEFRLQYASTDRSADRGRPLQGRRAALAAGRRRARARQARLVPPGRLRSRAGRRTWERRSASSSAASC